MPDESNAIVIVNPNLQRATSHPAMRQSGRGYDIWAVPSQGGEAVQLTANPNGDAFPTWSPDGEWVYFFRQTGQDRTLWRMRPDGEDEQPLGDWWHNAGWSLDGQTMYLFSVTAPRRVGLWAATLEGKPLRLLTAQGPQGEFLGSARLGTLINQGMASDGRYLYFPWRPPPPATFG